MKWGNILFAEIAFFLFTLYGLRYVKLPRFMMRRKLSSHFPWGYYADQIPTTSQAYIQENATDFMYDLGAEFGGPEGFGDFGEFSGFGELGEYGGSFFSDG